MATSTATLLVNVITNTTGAVNGMDKMSGRMGKFQSVMRSAMVPAAAAGAVLIGFGVAAGKAASDAEQAFGGVDAVFQENSKIVKRWADMAANDVGLAKDEYATLATMIGGQLKNSGMSINEASKHTKELITTAADLAATYGGTTKQAVEALGSAMRGEADPAEQFNLNLKEGAIQAQMAADGTDKLTGSAKDAARQQALLALVEKQSADARGKFAKEADTAAGQQQRAAANWRNAMIDLGAVLLPVMTKAASLLSKVAVWMAKNKTLVIALATAIGIMVIAVLAVNVALWAMSLTPITIWIAAVVVGVLLLVAGLTTLYRKSATARKIMNALWKGIKDEFKRVAKFIVAAVKSWVPVWRAVFAVLKGYVRAFMAYFKLVFNVIKGVVKLVVAVFKGDWRGAFTALKDIVRAFKTFFVDIFNILKTPVENLGEKIKTGLGNAVEWIKGKVAGMGDKLSAPFDAAKNAIGWLVDKIDDLIGALSNIHWPSPPNWLSKVPGLGSIMSVAAPSGVMGARGVGGYAAPRVPGVGARGRAASSGGVNINVNGALDPEAVARQIQRILAGHDRRVGLRVS